MPIANVYTLVDLFYVVHNFFLNVESKIFNYSKI